MRMDEQTPPAGRPAFLDPERAESINYPGAPDGSTEVIFDHELQLEPLELPGEALAPVGKGPSPGVKDRYIAIARLHAYGYSNNQIARHLGYSATGISLALKKPFIQAEIERHRAQLFDPDVQNRLKLMGRDAVDHVHRTILDPAVKDELRSTNARWAVEKLTGKPKQEVNVESGTLNQFMDLLKQMGPGAAGPESRDVTDVAQIAAPDAAPQEADPWSGWLQTNF